MTTLSELFVEAGTDTISHRGRVVKALVRLPVRDGSVITIRRTHASAARPQALKLALDAGLLTVNDKQAPALALWSTTSPDTVEIGVSGDGAASVEIWNAWSMGGVETEWIGNAGMVTRTTNAGLILRCSDGIGPADFSDLEVDVSIRR